MENQATKIIPLAPREQDEAGAEPPAAASGPSAGAREVTERPELAGDLLQILATHSGQMGRLREERRRSLAEISVLRAENRWEDLLALFHPVAEKLPELAAVGLATSIQAEVAFALSQLGRFEEAIGLYQRCLEAEPEAFHYHAGLAYTAYNSLYAAKTRQVMLHPAERQARIALAHRHFASAQQLRPEGITNYYRQGMLFKQIQGKTLEALPLFDAAVRNWRAYAEEQRQARHQERKNYIKALYQLASCELENGQPRKALEVLTRCLEEDRSSEYLSAVHKHYALGKVHFHLGDYQAARHALSLAATLADPSHNAYVFEMLARVHLAEKQPEQARETLSRVPPAARRPYIRWTEADVLVALEQVDQARRVLRDAAERDRRSRHKALLRLTRLEFLEDRYEESLRHAEQANSFFRNTYGNACYEALFWQAAALLRLRRTEEANRLVEELAALQPHYPNLTQLRKMLRQSREEPE